MSSNRNGVMGMSKHRKSGRSPKSPRIIHAMERDASLNSDRKLRPSTCVYATVSEAVKHE